MAHLTIRDYDYSEDLCDFMLKCSNCGSANTDLDIESYGWLKIVVYCDDCEHHQVIYDN